MLHSSLLDLQPNLSVSRHREFNLNESSLRELPLLKHFLILLPSLIALTALVSIPSSTQQTPLMLNFLLSLEFLNNLLPLPLDNLLPPLFHSNPFSLNNPSNHSNHFSLNNPSNPSNHFSPSNPSSLNNPSNPNNLSNHNNHLLLNNNPSNLLFFSSPHSQSNSKLSDSPDNKLQFNLRVP